MFDNNTHMVRSKFISSQIKMPEPDQLIAQSAVIFIHRVICRKIPKQIYDQLEFPAHSSQLTAPRVKHKPQTGHQERATLNEAVRIYSNLSPLVRDLPEYMFIQHVKSGRISIEPNPT